MYTLTFTEPSGRRDSFPLSDEERGLVVGRDPGCDVAVHSKEVSRRHARIYVRDGQLFIEDLGSHNGVYLDGVRMEGPSALATGKEVELGDVKLMASGAAIDKAAQTRPEPKRAPVADPTAAPAAGSARAGAAAARARAIERARASGKEKPKAVAPALPETVDSPKIERRPLPPPPPGVLGVGAGAALRGLGVASKMQLTLPGTAIVGRGKDCAVVLDDDSVSRQHAEFFRDGRGLTRLRDLGSANGTFVDGRRVEDGELLADGTKVRFGDVELLFWKPPERTLLGSARQRQFLVMAAALLVGFGVLYLLRERKAEREAAELSQVQDTPEEQARALNGQAQGALSSDRFDEAVRLAQSAIDRDPLGDAPRKTLLLARREQLAKKTFDDAQAKAALGNEDEALRMLAQVDPQSRFFARARIKAKELAPGALRDHARTCATESAHERWESAADACEKALDLKCQTVSVEKDPLLKSMRRAERALQRRVPWHCPAALAPLFHDTVAVSPEEAQSADRALRARYEDDKVLEAVLQYVRGDLAGALRGLSAPSVLKGKSGALAAQAAEQMRLVEGRFREGQTALLRGELSRTHDLWLQALRADGAILPLALDSFYATQIRGTLTDAHVKAGDDKFAKSQYQSAYDAWTHALEVNPKDPRVLDSLARLERVAVDILSESPGCDRLSTALRITRADPPSPAHLAATKASQGCK